MLINFCRDSTFDFKIVSEIYELLVLLFFHQSVEIAKIQFEDLVWEGLNVKKETLSTKSNKSEQMIEKVRRVDRLADINCFLRKRSSTWGEPRRSACLSWKVRYRTFPWFFSQMSKLYRARSLLYRRQNLQVNIRWKALDEIYKIYMLLHRSDPVSYTHLRAHET